MTCPILTLACAVNSVCSIYSNPGVHTVDGWMNEVEIKTLIHRIIHRITKKKSNKCCRVAFVEENNATKLVNHLKRHHNFQYKECKKAKIKQCSGCQHDVYHTNSNIHNNEHVRSIKFTH